MRLMHSCLDQGRGHSTLLIEKSVDRSGIVHGRPSKNLGALKDGGPVHGPVSWPHIYVRTDDTPRKMVYLLAHTGMANARVPPLAPSRNGSPGLPRPPDAGRGFSFRLAMTVLPLLQGWYCGLRRSWPLASSYRDKISLVRAGA
jgi:hypothetical protein